MTSDDESSVTGGVRETVQAAKLGGDLGAKVGGGYGAAIGAAAGTAVGLAKNRKTRRLLVAMLVAPLLLALVAASVISMSIGGVIASTTQREQQQALTAVSVEGVDEADTTTYVEAADSSGVHWTLLAAIDRAAGQWAGPGEPAYGVEDLEDFNEALVDHNIDPVTAETLKDRVATGYTVGRLFASEVARRAPDVSPYDIDVGAGTMPDPTDASSTMRGIDPDDSDAAAAHELTKGTYQEVLADLPINVAAQAEEIFDAAYRWALGQPQRGLSATACTPATGAVVGIGEVEGVSVDGFSAEQIANVATVVKVGRELKLPPKAWQIAIMTILVEAQALNLDYGDRDSQGLYQQRPSSGWGTIEQITDPVLATKAFFGLADHTDNPGLVDLEGWESMAPGDAAQAVQRSAFPDAYALREQDAQRLLKEVGGADAAAAASAATTPDSCLDADGQAALGDFANCPVSPWPELETPPQLGRQIPPDALRTLRCGHAAFPEFTSAITYGQRAIAADEHGTGRAVDWMVPGGWQNAAGKAVADRMAKWLEDNAKPLGVEYIIWDQRIWSMARASEGWRPMEDRGSPTENHLDHVHVTLYGNKGVVAAPVADGQWGPPTLLNYQLGPGICASGTVCWGYSGHTGQDLTAGENSPIVAVAGGRVKTAKVFCPELSNAARSGNYGCSYGRLLVIDHGGGIESYYGHLNEFAAGITAGATVKTGQQIGAEGSQGKSSGSHLHFEIRKDGAIVNPVDYLERQGVNLRCAPTLQGIYGDVPSGSCAR